MTDYKEIKKALDNYLNSLTLLTKLGVTMNKKDFTSQIGEWFIAELYGGKRADSGIQKDWDIKIEDKYIQVKTHSKAATTTARWSSVKYDENAQISEIITVVFTPNYKIKEFYKTPWSEALKLIKRQRHRDVLNWDDQKKFQIKIEDLPKQNLVSLFKI
jgi:hypothetical protein